MAVMQRQEATGGRRHLSIYLSGDDAARAEAIAQERRTPLATTVSWLVAQAIARYEATPPGRRR